MNPKRPEGNWADALVFTLLHPVQAMRLQVGRGAGWNGAPWSLWYALAFVAVLGSLIYGASLALALPAGGWLYAAVALAASAGAGWLLFGTVLLGLSRRPAAHLAHASLVAMTYGEAVLELGVIANLIFRDWAGALALNLAVVGLSNLVMLVALVAQLRVAGVRPWLVIALWFGILNTAGIAFFRLFNPQLLPF